MSDVRFGFGLTLLVLLALVFTLPLLGSSALATSNGNSQGHRQAVASATLKPSPNHRTKTTTKPTATSAPSRTPTPVVTPAPPAADPTTPPDPTNPPAPTNAPDPTAAPTSAPQGTYVFDDEFNGTSLNPVWGHWMTCCGTIVGYNPPVEADGSLQLTVSHTPAGWLGGLVDTHAAWTHTYGYFEARIWIPEGTGLWPAFWLYNAGSPEIDTMEICANPLGTNGGNDVSVLHTTVHYGSGSSTGGSDRTSNLSAGWHTYGLDWRSTYLAFYLDGAQVWRETSGLVSTPQAITLNLGVGGSWCGNPTVATPSSATMLVDWVRVSP